MLPRVGVSACLLGEPVRYDGGHKRHDILMERFMGLVEWVSVCPEAELGLGVPRETIALERINGDVRLLASETRRDLTDAMRGWAAARLDRLGDLCGFVLKARSPSCAVLSAPVAGDSVPYDGLWASAVRSRLPWLPLADEEQLASPDSAGRFLFRAKECRRLNELFRKKWTPGDLVEFHTSAKLLLLAYAPDAYRELGRLVAHPTDTPTFEANYRIQYMDALKEPPTPGRESNALAHAFGYFSDRLPPAERQALAQQIAAVARSEASPGEVKQKLLAHAQEFGIDYLTQQRYLTD